MKIQRVEKLVANLQDKEEYVKLKTNLKLKTNIKSWFSSEISS